MVYQSAADVIMGCGHPWYDADGVKRQNPYGDKYVGGIGTYNDLVAGTAGGDADGDGVADHWTLVESRAAFQALTNGATPKRVLGLAQVYQTLQQARSGDGDAAPYVVPQIQSVPTLEEMTRGALNVLDNDPDGFVLMIEGGAVDWACHANQLGRTIEEEIDFNDAVDAVIDWVQSNSNWGETLVIVTGDHETGYLCSERSDPNGDPEPAYVPLVNHGEGVEPGVEWHSGGHTNSLIPLFAKGCGASLLKQCAGDADPYRGPYLDNTDMARVALRALLGR
jgi:alkaline phosphatase